MITLNLLPDVKLEYLRTRRVQAKVISIATTITIVAVGLIVLVAAWVYGGQTLQKSYLSGEIVKNTASLKAIPDIDKYLTLQNQLAKLTALHEGKNDFSRLLAYLPLVNPAPPNNVTLISIELTSSDEGSLLTFQGEAKDYTGLNTFRDTLQNAELKYGDQTEKLFETVSVTSSTLEQSAQGTSVIVFNINTTYNPNAFLFSIKNPTVNVPQRNTTQSVQSAPDVFGKSSVKKEEQ